MSKRQCKDWLDTYVQYTNNTEPPTSYHIWTGLCVISAALQRRAYLKWGYDTIYPNIYAVLAGRSGRTRKGTAMRIGKRLLSQLNNINIVSESVTREALIRFMKDSGQNFSDPTSGVFKMHSSIVCFSEELQVFLGERNIKFLADLTDWYDSSEMWTYQTKGCGTDKISGICLTLLGASAPDWFDTMFPPQAIGGGFTSRVIFIWEEDKKQTVAEPITTPEEIELGKHLLKDLEKIMLLGGEFLMTTDAREFYVDWYLNHERNMKAGNPPIPNAIFAGYCERRATHIRKLSMLCSAARGDDMTIKLCDVKRALNLLLDVEPNMPAAFGGQGRARYSEVLNQIIEYIKKMGSVSKAVVFQRFINDIDFELARCMEDMFRNSRLVAIEVLPDRSDTIYHYRGPKK